MHNNISVVFNSARRPENNLRDIRLVYGLTYLSYSVIGVSGCLGVLDRPPIVKQQNTMLDFLASDNSLVFCINWFLMMKYAFQIPYFIYIGKLQVFQVFYETREDVPGWCEALFNLVVIGTSFLFGTYNYEPVELLAVCGGVVAYILIYLFPILIHLSCVYTLSCKHTIQSTRKEEEMKALLSNDLSMTAP